MAIIDGTPGHPSHPPLTDVSIGAYTVATLLAVIGLIGWNESQMAVGSWLALAVGLAFALPTATTGLVDWLRLPGGSAEKRTATWHMLVMLTATVIFALAAIIGYSSFELSALSTGAATLTLLGFAILTLGGWLGGTVVFVHGVRVLDRPDQPTREAVKPIPERRAG